MGEFFHALRVFGDDLAAVQWQYLAIALGLHLLKLVFRAIAWRTILRASYPGRPISFWSTLGAYVAGVGVNSIAPARGGDVVKLYLIKHRIPDASYATLTPTLLVETLADFVIAGGADPLGARDRRPAGARGLLAAAVGRLGLLHPHRKETAAAFCILASIALIAFFHFAQRGSELRARVSRGFAVLRQPRRFALGVVAPQLVSWVLRIASMYYFLLAFGVNATVHNALLAQVVDSLATLFPATPGGAGTKQGLIVFLFASEAIDNSLLLAFSVGMNVAIVVFNLIAGAIALFMMARTISWKRIKRAQAQDAQAQDIQARDETV